MTVCAVGLGDDLASLVMVSASGRAYGPMGSLWDRRGCSGLDVGDVRRSGAACSVGVTP